MPSVIYQNSAKTKESRLKILVLIKGLGLGGAERLIVDSLPYLDQERFEYHFAYFLRWKDFLAPRIEAAGFPLHCLGMQHNAQLPLMLPQLYRLQRRHQFDLIHAHLPVSGIIARLAGRFTAQPVVYTEHVRPDHYHPVIRWLNGLTYGWNHRVTTVSSEVTASLKSKGLTRKVPVQTVLNGVPVERVRAEGKNQNGLRAELDIPESHLVVGTVAVFRRQKRLDAWLAAAAQIAAQYKNVTFLLVGDGPEFPQLQAQAQALELGERICMPGFRPDGRRLMGLMDVYLMSSEFEGLSVALLEAMALGKPVVSTMVDGVLEVIEHEVEGLLTPVGAVDALAEYTLALLKDEPRRLQLGQCGAKKIETQFHWQERVRRTEQLYLEILS